MQRSISCTTCHRGPARRRRPRRRRRRSVRPQFVPGRRAATDEPSRLTFQSWVPNIDQAVDAFNEAHDDIHVTLETITAGPDGGYAKMLSAVQAGNPADVAQVGYDAIPDFLVNDALEDITDYVADSADLFTDVAVADRRLRRSRLRDPAGVAARSASSTARTSSTRSASRPRPRGTSTTRRPRPSTPPTRTATSPRSRSTRRRG